MERVTTLLGKAPLDHYCPLEAKQGRKEERKEEGQNRSAPPTFPQPLTSSIPCDPGSKPPHHHAPWTDLKAMSPSCPSLPPCSTSSPRWWPGLLPLPQCKGSLVWLQLLQLSWVTHLFPYTLSNHHSHRHTCSMERPLTGDSISHASCSALGWHPVVPSG